MALVDKLRVSGFVAGEDSGRRVLTKILSQEIAGLTQWQSGSFSLPASTTEVVDFNTMTSALFVMVETSTSCTILMSDTQKLNIDGLAVFRVWTNKSVVDITVSNSDSSNASTINWAAVS